LLKINQNVLNKERNSLLLSPPHKQPDLKSFSQVFLSSVAAQQLLLRRGRREGERERGREAGFCKQGFVSRVL